MADGLIGAAFDQWYKLVIAAGVALTVAGTPGHDRPLMLVGIGLVLWGIEEFINHPFETQLHYDNAGFVTGKLSGRPFRPSAVGFALDVVGIGLAGYGLVRMLIE